MDPGADGRAGPARWPEPTAADRSHGDLWEAGEAAGKSLDEELDESAPGRTVGEVGAEPVDVGGDVDAGVDLDVDVEEPNEDLGSGVGLEEPAGEDPGVEWPEPAAAPEAGDDVLEGELAGDELVDDELLDEEMTDEEMTGEASAEDGFVESDPGGPGESGDDTSSPGSSDDAGAAGASPAAGIINLLKRSIGLGTGATSRGVEGGQAAEEESREPGDEGHEHEADLEEDFDLDEDFDLEEDMEESGGVEPAARGDAEFPGDPGPDEFDLEDDLELQDPEENGDAGGAADAVAPRDSGRSPGSGAGPSTEPSDGVAVGSAPRSRRANEILSRLRTVSLRHQEKAREHLGAARSLYRKGEYERAREEALRAHDLDPRTASEVETLIERIAGRAPRAR